MERTKRIVITILLLFPFLFIAHHAQGSSEFFAVKNYGFGCSDMSCPWVILSDAETYIGEIFEIETSNPESGEVLGRYQRTLNSNSYFSFQPETANENKLLNEASGLKVTFLMSNNPSQQGSVIVKRPVIDSRLVVQDSKPHLSLKFNPSDEFISQKYKLFFYDIQSGEIFRKIYSEPVSSNNHSVLIDLSADPYFYNKIDNHGVYLLSGPLESSFWPKVLITRNLVGYIDNFHRRTQVQGHLFGMGLIEIPEYLVSGVDLGYKKKRNFSKEIPFVDNFSINRFLGGYPLSWLIKYNLVDPELGERSLDFAYINDKGAMNFQEDLIYARLDPYLEAGYDFENITINIENIPYDLAIDGGSEDIWGQNLPPADWDTWRYTLHVLSWYLQHSKYPLESVNKLSFKIGNEYDHKTSFSGTEQDYFDYYYHSQHVLNVHFPDSEIIPGEFTGHGICVPVEDPNCTYDTRHLVDEASSGGWRMDAVPRSLHAIFGISDNAQLLPDIVVHERALFSYERLGEVISEIHQFGLLGQPDLEGIDLTRGSDVGARAATWEFQSLMNLKERLNPRSVAGWTGIMSFGSVHLLTGTGYIRNFLDQMNGYKGIRLKLITNEDDKNDLSETSAYAFIKGNNTILVISNCSVDGESSLARVRLNIPDLIMKNNPDLSHSQYIVYNQENNVHALIRDDLKQANNLNDYFGNNINSLADFRVMAKDVSLAREMILDNQPKYEERVKDNLTYKKISEQNRILYDASNNFFWAPIKGNELIIIKLNK